MKKLTRSTEDRWIGGVCAGIADYTGVDVTIVRLAVVVATLLGVGSLVIGYVLAWMIMPAAPRFVPTTSAGTPPPSR